MAAKQPMKENVQCTSKYGHLRISQDICHVRMTDIEGFLTIYGHSDNLLNNKNVYLAAQTWKKEAPYRKTWKIRHVFHKLRMLEKNASSLMF